MIIKTFVNPPLENNNYVIIDKQSSEAILIDCSAPSPDALAFIKENNAKLKYILITHGHFDHIMGINYFKKECNIPVYLHKNDKGLVLSICDYIPNTKIPQIDNYFDDNATFNIGNQIIKVIPTPGHTSGSVSFLLNDILFSGDTMFYHGYGRTDLPTGNTTELFKSLDKILSLPPETRVFSGHGKETTINEELNFYRG